MPVDEASLAFTGIELSFRFRTEPPPACDMANSMSRTKFSGDTETLLAIALCEGGSYQPLDRPKTTLMAERLADDEDNTYDQITIPRRVSKSV
jgi:hypothetical protein